MKVRLKRRGPWIYPTAPWLKLRVRVGELQRSDVWKRELKYLFELALQTRPEFTETKTRFVREFFEGLMDYLSCYCPEDMKAVQEFYEEVRDRVGDYLKDVELVVS